MTKVTLVLGENTLEKNQVLAQKYSSQCDLFELRGDYLDEKEWANLPTFPQKLQKPTILTIRLPIDGGVWRQSEDLRIGPLSSGFGRTMVRHRSRRKSDYA
jgi:3-dehydroquinate dehydratase